MAEAKSGDRVRVHYTGKLADGSVFDTSTEGDPLEFTLGLKQVIRGFEEAVTGMSVGETRTAAIQPEEAYGPHMAEKVLVVRPDQFPPGLTPEEGQELQLNQKTGRPMLVRVTEVTATSVTLDANHPLAGKELTFDIELVGIGE